jgi:hypothetical protein
VEQSSIAASNRSCQLACRLRISPSVRNCLN